MRKDLFYTDQKSSSFLYYAIGFIDYSLNAAIVISLKFTKYYPIYKKKVFLLIILNQKCNWRNVRAGFGPRFVISCPHF